MKSFVRVALLVSVVWFPSVRAAQPAAVASKPAAAKTSPFAGMQSWLREKVRLIGTTILPTSSTPETICTPTPDNPNGCTDIDRTKTPVG